jgi:hypothetical protein
MLFIRGQNLGAPSWGLSPAIQSGPNTLFTVFTLFTLFVNSRASHQYSRTSRNDAMGQE